MPPTVRIIEARGLVSRADQGVDSRYCVVGCSSTGDEGLGPLYGNPSPAIEEYGHGDGIDAFTHALSRTRIPGAFAKAASSTPGSYRTIDVTDVTGTALVSNPATPTPLGTYEATIEIVDGGTLGVSGITFYWSLNALRKRSALLSLGTATSYTIANSGVRFNFEPPAAQVTALITYANAIRTAFLAHIVYTTGTVHGAADSTSDDAVQAAATTLATVVSLLPTLLAAQALHNARGSTVHITADVTTSIAAATTAVAASTASGTAQDALSACIALEAALEAHEALLSAHTIADAVNVVSATVPTRGTLDAGDIVTVPTIAPKWAADDLYDKTTAPSTGVLETVRTNSNRFGLVYIAEPVTASDCDTLSTWLDDMNAAGRRPSLIVRTRGPNPGEGEAAWMAAIIADFAALEDDRITVCAGEAWVTDPVSARSYLRTWAPAFLSRSIAVPIFVQPGAPADQELEGVTLNDTSGALIGHDEGESGTATGLDLQRFATVYRGTEFPFQDNVYAGTPFTMYPADGRIRTHQVRRLACAMENVAASVSFAQIGGTTFYDPEALTLDDTAKKAIEAKIRQPLSSQFSRAIQNPNADNLVGVDDAVTVENGIVNIAVTVSPRPFGYIGDVDITFSLEVA
jgi:hypothetical protein